MATFKLFNTASRSVEDFTPLVPGHVGMYSCGPTVYWDAHIGNMRSYVMEDVLQRTLEIDGFEVKRVMNITDVGHLTDDADAGEDKMEKASAREGRSAQEIADTYTKRFLEDATKLNIAIPHAPYLCKATDHIPEQIELIKILEQKGFTYRISDGIYFDTSKFPAYGSFSGQKLEEKEEGARVAANPEKRNKSDFALWKFSPKDSKRQMEWESPWGIGFPGWHIECSAMSHKYLGQPFDIHCGGIDHIPVHHENEIAQSVAAYGVKLSDYWMHVEFLLVDGQKMSKSLGNVYTVSDLITKGFDPLALRLFFLGAHYRQKQNFTWEALSASQSALNRLRALSREWDAPTILDVETEIEFLAAIDDDLNTAKALAVMWKCVDADIPSGAKAASLLWMDEVLGLSLDSVVSQPVAVPQDIKLLAQERDEARANQDWATSDKVRSELEAKGWTVEDTKDGQKLTPKA
ncbi:MAG: cysteine--tRNA ligase [Patescibacteria group bacterium]